MSIEIPNSDGRALEAARIRQSNLTKPPGSLGRLEDIAIQLAAFQGKEVPSAIPACTLFAADHPVTRHGVSPYPSAVTRAMVQNFVEGGAAASVLCATWSIPLWVIDVGVDAEPGTSRSTSHGDAPSSDGEPRTTRSSSGVHLVRHPVSSLGAGDLRVEDAMTDAVFAGCLQAGREAVLALHPDTTVLIVGDMGIGNSTVAACVCAALLGGEPAQWVGAGTGADDAMRTTKAAVCHDAVARLGGSRDPREILRRVGGREVVAMYGAMIAALERRITVLVDGFIATSAALALCIEQPNAKRGLLWAHRSAERAHNAVLERLDVRPLLDLGMRLGEGSGALLAYPIVASACALHRRMATFESAGVPDRKDDRDTLDEIHSR